MEKVGYAEVIEEFVRRGRGFRMDGSFGWFVWMIRLDDSCGWNLWDRGAPSEKMMQQ